MDTSALSLAVDRTGVPDAPWVAAAVRHGVRTSLEMLRVPRVPRQVRLSGAPISLTARAEAALGRGGVNRQGRVIHTHTRSDITISYPAILNTAALQASAASANPAAADQALRFYAGYAAARYAVDVARAQTPSWAAGLDEAGQEAHDHRVACAMATVASGFTLVARGDSADAQTEAVGMFLDRLRVISDEEGLPAIWRGMVAKGVHALARNVRFLTTPGKVAALGHPLRAPADVRLLLAYVRGTGAWPFQFQG